MGRDTSFYYSFLVLPPEKRRAMVAVWDFCRAVDDSVDEAGAAGSGRNAAAAVAQWRAELEAIFGDREPATPQGRALVPYVGRYSLPRASFEALVEGVEMDLVRHRYETFPQLYEYCIRVASAVGLICVEIFGYRDPRAREYATELGVALQLTNILRDVPEDLARGRLYIPLEDLRRHGVAEADLAAEAAETGGAVRSPAVRALLAQQAARAREYYARADACLPPGDARQLVAAEIMGAIYRRLLDRIEAGGYDVFSRVVRVPRPARARIAARTWLLTLLRGTLIFRLIR